MTKVIGIDLGTSISKMASIVQGEPKCLDSREGSVLIPSIVAVTKSGERLVGDIAKRQAVTNPKNTIFAVKRFIGIRYDDPEVQKELKRLPYETRKKDDGSVEVKLGEKLDAAVITCPANFDDSQRKATKTAGEIAGFNVLRIINDPTAAALAYGFGKKESQKVMVYDFGGGTLDVTVLETSPDTVEVLSTGGEPHLGGEDFDQRVMNWLIEQFKKERGIDLSRDPLALLRIKEAAEKAKIELSSSLETEINLPFVSADSAG